jgi:uncharacterized protein Yka (UPF0111/DUF47 family)
MSKTIQDLEREADRLRNEIFALKKSGTITESTRRVELREGEDLHDRTVRRIRKWRDSLPKLTRRASWRTSKNL